VIAGLILLAGLAAPPGTAAGGVSDTYHGVSVADPYRWLEDWSEPRVKAWSAAQNSYARAALGRLPAVAGLREAIRRVLSEDATAPRSHVFRAGILFSLARDPDKQQPVLSRAAWGERERPTVLVDPNAIDTTGTTVIDWYVPSPDGALIAVSLSRAGSEAGDVHVFETSSGKQVYEVVPRVNGGTAGGDLAWAPDGRGFYYTRYPRAGERKPADMAFYMQVYFHALGTATAADRYELGKDLPRIAEIMLDVHEPSGRVLATVQDGDSGRFAHYMRAPDGAWKQFSRFGDKIVQAVFGPGDQLFVLSRQGAPRGKLVRTSSAAPDVAAAVTIVPEGKDTLVDDFWGPSPYVATPNRLYVTVQLGGPSEIRAYNFDGKLAGAPIQTPVSAVHRLTPLAGDSLAFVQQSFTTQRLWMHYDAKKGATARLYKPDGPATNSLAAIDVRREFATSKDGTKVPVNILVPPGVKLTGDNPCIVTGYGGFGISLQPRLRATTTVLLEQGVVYAVANLRGGGEFGSKWHREGTLTQKQNVFDDFAAVLQHLIDRKYTSSKRLGIVGGSNGGLLMGALLTQHPKLMRAVVTYVGIYDMLRVELSSNGAFNIPEFGTVKDPAQFRALHAYSPYHQVADRTAYPATLLLTGANDPRVDPMQSRKMTARLQAATSGKAPILLRTSSKSGHGRDAGLNEKVNKAADAFAFLFEHLGVTYRAPSK